MELSNTMITAAFAVLVVAIIILFARMLYLEKRLKVFLNSGKVSDLEGVFALMRSEVLEARKELSKLDTQSRDFERRVRRSTQHVGMVRYNPFRDDGGDQSFSVALLDEARSGVVISSLYARDGVRVYGKPIKKGSSSYKLSDEEERAIKEAISEKRQ